MVYFNEDFNQFFKDLAAHNHKDWFDENRGRYEKNVKIPFENFVDALITNLKKKGVPIDMEAKKAIFRINRDIRFSKDKTPYKLNRSAAISSEGKKNSGHAGLYFQFGPENISIGGGAYQPNKQELQLIRQHITENRIDFEQAIKQASFKETFGTLQGEKNKRLPSEFVEAATNIPELFNKQFYYMAEFPAEIITDKLLMDFVVEKYFDADMIRTFLQTALHS